MGLQYRHGRKQPDSARHDVHIGTMPSSPMSSSFHGDLYSLNHEECQLGGLASQWIQAALLLDRDPDSLHVSQHFSTPSYPLQLMEDRTWPRLAEPAGQALG